MQLECREFPALDALSAPQVCGTSKEGGAIIDHSNPIPRSEIVGQKRYNEDCLGSSLKNPEIHMAQITFENLVKIYPGDVKVVNSINLHIKDREFVVLVGPSGCGKSTTLRMIAGLEDITGGKIIIGDRVVNDIPPKDRDIAMVFQNYALYPHMSVYENMAFGLTLRKLPKAQIHARVTEAAKILDISHLLERKPKALSGGQRQRVAVGRAIVRNPAAFLFDEPLSNLDAKLRVTTRAEIKRLHQRLRTTTIYVTHDQEEAMTLGDRIVVMKDGHIQQADSPLQTYNSPTNRFVAGFIGMPPMNFIDGVIARADGELVFLEGNRSGGHSDADHDDSRPAEPQGQLKIPAGKGFTFPVPEHLKSRLAGHVGKEIVLGIRPEHLILRPHQGATTPIAVRVNVTEPLGHQMDLYLSTQLNDHLIARIEAQSGIAEQSEITMYVDGQKIHFFEPGPVGTNISLPSPASPVAAA